MSPGIIPGSGPAVVQGFAAQFQGIPNGVLLDTNSPEGGRRGPGGLVLHRALEWEWSWRPGITPDAGVGVVLEAWCYTRAAGTEVIHVAAAGFQGIPDCVARYKFPQNMATTESIPTAARGVDTNGLRHLYQGSVGDGKRLEYWFLKLTRGH